MLFVRSLSSSWSLRSGLHPRPGSWSRSSSVFVVGFYFSDLVPWVRLVCSRSFWVFICSFFRAFSCFFSCFFLSSFVLSWFFFNNFYFTVSSFMPFSFVFSFMIFPFMLVLSCFIFPFFFLSRFFFHTFSFTLFRFILFLQALFFRAFYCLFFHAFSHVFLSCFLFHPFFLSFFFSHTSAFPLASRPIVRWAAFELWASIGAKLGNGSITPRRASRLWCLSRQCNGWVCERPLA